MGARVNFELKFDENKSVHFYSHWGENSALIDLQNALKKAQSHGRLKDVSYCARIVFCYLVREDIDGGTGYGISPYYMDGLPISIDLEKQKVEDLTIEEFLILSEEYLNKYLVYLSNRYYKLLELENKNTTQ